MNQEKASKRISACRLLAALGAMVGAFAPLGACAQEPEILNQCNGQDVVVKITQKNVHFCLDRERWWIQEVQNFSTMAALCCNDQKRALAALSKGLDARHPRTGLWYPLDASLIKPALLAQLTAATASPADPLSNAPPLVSPKHETTPKPSVTPQRLVPFFEDWRIWLGMPVITLVIALFFLTLWRFFRVKEKGKDSPPAGGDDAQDLPAALAEPLAVALRQAFPSKIIVELAPPQAARLSEWDPLLKRLAEILKSSAASSDSDSKQGDADDKRTPGARGFAQEAGPQKPSSQGRSGERRFVQRETTYSPAAKSFGGDFAFQETTHPRAAFFVDVLDGGNALLYPNPAAADFDPLHQNLFNLGVSDFPLKISVSPKRVRREGQRWVLESQSR
jgi:hypothetical protein